MKGKTAGIFIVFFVLFFCAFFCSCSQNTPLLPHYSHTTYNLELRKGKVVSDTDWVMVLEKDPDKDFVILNLTDIQLGTGEYLGSFDHIRRMVTELVAKTGPDLIICEFHCKIKHEIECQLFSQAV